jgi:transcriptional regulator with XRE-family HTH domain
LPKQLDGKLAELIRKTRAQRGFTEQALAAHAGLSRRQLRLIQQGANTTVLRVIGLAHALGLTEVDLGGGVKGRVNPSPSRPVDVRHVLRHLDVIEKRVRSAREALSQPRVRRSR